MDAVWQCEGAKSPGPDGYNFNFIKKNWELLKEDFVAALSLFHETGCIPKGCNASFIALVPKVRDPSKLEQYRPISLVGAIYKNHTFFLWILLMSALPSSLVEPNLMCLISFGRLRHSQIWSWQLGECCWIESQQGWVWVGEGWWWNLRYVQYVSLRRSLVNIPSWSVNMHIGYGPCASNG